MKWDLGLRAYAWYAELRWETGLRCESAVYRHRAQLQEAGVACPAAFYVGDSYPTKNGEPDDASLCLFVCCDRRTAVRTVQVLEDMSTNYDPGPSYQHMEDEKAKLMLQNLAKLHAWGWGKADALPIAGMWDRSPHEAMFAGFASKQRKTVSEIHNGKVCEKYLRMWNDYESLNLDGTKTRLLIEHPEFVAMCRTLVETHASWYPQWASLWPEERGDAKPLGSTILHGDAHQWNHMFRKADADAALPEVVLLDWQFTGGGHLAWEITYMLTCSREFTTVEADIMMLREYHAQLLGRLPPSVGEEYGWVRFYDEVLLVHISSVIAYLFNWSAFLSPSTCDKMLADPKQKELAIAGNLMRTRLFARLHAHVIEQPQVRARLLGDVVEEGEPPKHNESMTFENEIVK